MDALPAHLSPRKSSASSADGTNPGLTFRGRTPRSSDASAHDVEMSYSGSAGRGQAPSRFSFGGPGEAAAGMMAAPSSTLNPQAAAAGIYVHSPGFEAAGGNNGGSSSAYAGGYAGGSEPYSAKDKDVNGRIRASVRGHSAAKSLLLGACVAGTVLGLLATTGFFSRKPSAIAHGGRSFAAAAAGGGGARPHLRGRGSAVVTAAGKRIRTSPVDHHHARIILAHSLEPFVRRNVHHYSTHDAEGKLVPPGKHRENEDKQLPADWAADFAEERREYVRHPSDVLLKRLDQLQPGDPGYHEYEPLYPDERLPPPFLTSGAAKYVHVLHGVDDHHDFDSHDYFGSAMTRLAYNEKTGEATLAVGAPGAQGSSGVIYFIKVDRHGNIDDYTYLTREDAKDRGLGSVWGSNSAVGWALESVGDLNGDGHPDLALGALGFKDGSSKGAVLILYLDENLKIKDHSVIAENTGGFNHPLKDNARFGSSIAAIGDVDGDGVPDLAVGAMGSGKDRGAVYILMMNKNGSVKKATVIASLYGWEHKLTVGDAFGNAVRGIGDLDGDGVPDLVVSGDGFPAGESYGAVWVLFLKKDGTVKKWRRLDEMDEALEPEALFGASIDTLGDLDGDGKPELLVGAPGMHNLRGEAYIISLDKDAKIKHFKPLVEHDHELEDLVAENDEFGWSVLNLGDLDGDGSPELAISAETSPGYDNQPSLFIVSTQPQARPRK